MPRKPTPCANRSRNNKRNNGGDTDISAQSMENVYFKYRCSTTALPRIMKGIVGNDKQKCYVKEIGFGSFLSLADADVGNDRALTLWLVDKFNPDTEALEFEGGISIPVRPLVKSVLEIPSGPIEVVEGLDVDKALYAQYTCNSSTRPKNVRQVAEEMCSITDKEPFCIAFMMAILGIYLAPNSSVEVNKALLGAVKQVDKLKDMDWCNFVATYLFKGIKELKQKKEIKEFNTIYIKGCVHILSVIFIDFVKRPAFEVPVGFPRLGVVTAEHFKWVISHHFSSLKLCQAEESIYADSLASNMLKDNILEDGKCVDPKIDADVLPDKFATTDPDQNNKQHPVSAELATAVTSPNTTSLATVEHVELGTSPRSAGQTVLSTSRVEVQSSNHFEPCSAQIRGLMCVAADASKGVDSASTLPMENAGDRSAKKARVDRPSSAQANRAGGVAALDMKLLNCTLCLGPCKPPVFKCNGRHLACGRCLAELPREQCQTCEQGSGFSPCPIMDHIVSLAMVECSHDGCKSSVPYHELDDHEDVCPHAPCYCTELDCGFVGPPPALLGHLAAIHSVSVHNIHYGKEHRLRLSETRCLLHGVGDDSAFLLAIGALGAATVISVVCIRAGGSPLPRYRVKLWAIGPPAASNAADRVMVDMNAASSAKPGEVAVEELLSFLTVPPAYLVGSGASKEVTVDICIDKM